MSAVGLFEDFHYQATEFKILPDDALLLLTDGAYLRCEPEEILEYYKKYPGDEKGVIKEIFRSANDRGNLDNQSVMILQF
jgi:serine/threonine protein phosphatase PrpC